jgi:hypothetical protein
MLLNPASGAASDPLLAALVELLLPEGYPLLERVDRVLARGQRLLPVRRRDGDDDARLTDLDASCTVVDRDLAEVVAAFQFRGDLGHGRFGHLLVSLVVEVKDGAAA